MPKEVKSIKEYREKKKRGQKNQVAAGYSNADARAKSFEGTFRAPNIKEL